MWNLQLVSPCLPPHSLLAHTQSSHYTALYFKCPTPFLSATAVFQKFCSHRGWESVFRRKQTCLKEDYNCIEVLQVWSEHKTIQLIINPYL